MLHRLKPFVLGDLAELQQTSTLVEGHVWKARVTDAHPLKFHESVAKKPRKALTSTITLAGSHLV